VFQIARRFQDAIAAHKFPKLGREAPDTLAISGGLATYPWDGRTPVELLARADELSIQSKRSGKNCITLGPGAERERDGGA
jgi:PleD family two-component response regulator